MCMFCVSRRPSGRLEVVQLMGMMDDMLLKAGVDQQREELTEISQVRQTDIQGEHRLLFAPVVDTCAIFNLKLNKLNKKTKVLRHT